ncbi:GMP/IMP nucleotidase [Reinekea marinisedimentorum]|uniref:Putative hydrolase of the HAD superfamily n=1 Tax=Reinekea marinisedimentorum TaxID=230495 RepID=A0A4R3IBW5_9GAMM|nr:GMP/IMP nucleotidase [Reinekea marinisedimentorum]TCS43991.1 putative hydrolase of the HAD superfamily [Reinekea marinisedimentorum]
MAILSPEQWDDISWVLLDMDGTLLDLCFDDTLWRIALPKAYAEHHQITEDEASKTIIQLAEQAWGKLDWYCLDYWSEQVGFDIRPVKSELSHLIGFRKGALAFLKWLKHHNKHVILATNAHPDSIALKDLHTDLSQWVDVIMDAHSANAPKESPGYWQWLQEKTNYIAGQTLFIDDNDHILDAAANAGIAHCLGVKTPNSQGRVYDSRYPAFDHFQELYLPSI